MVDIAWQRAKWFFFLKAFVGVLLSCFQSVFQRELELLNSVDILSLYGAFGILLVGFESFLLSYLLWVIGGQLIENQPLLRQIYKEPPILSRDNLSSKMSCPLRATVAKWWRSKHCVKMEKCILQPIRLILVCKTKLPRGLLKKIIKQKIKTTERIVKGLRFL